MLKCLAIFAVLAFPTFVLGQTVHKAKIKGDGAQQTAPDKRGTQDSPLIVETRPADGDQEAAKEARKEAKQDHVNSVNIALAGVIAACAALQSLGTAVQIRVYIRQTNLLNQTLGEVHAQAGHMREQVDLMRQQSEIAINKERARLSVVPAEIDTIDTISDPFSWFEVAIQNYGPTTALDVVIKGVAEMRPKETSDLVLSSLEGTGPDAVPAGIATKGAVNDVTETDVIAAINEKSLRSFYIYLQGVVQYVDVFGNRHSTNFFYRKDVYRVMGEDTKTKRLRVIALKWRKAGKPEDNEST